MAQFKRIALFSTVALFVWGCMDDPTPVTGGGPGRSSSSYTVSSSGGSTPGTSSGTDIPPLSSEQISSSSSQALPDSTEEGTPYCAPTCTSSKMYAVGERCMYLFKNWVALQETNQMPTTRPEHWTDEGKCHQSTIIE